MQNNKPDFFRIASEFYICEVLPQDYEDMEDDEFYEFLEQNAWEPFMYYSGEDLEGAIKGLSIRMSIIHTNAEMNKLDEVRQVLNIQ